MIAGQVILGCVQEVHNYELRVSLPHKLVGTVTIAQISKAYTALLTKVIMEPGVINIYIIFLHVGAKEIIPS